MAEYKSNYTGQQIDAGIGKANTAVQPADLSSYQEKLVSGENIKTINGTSILGEGNMVIEGGSGGLSSVAHDNTMTGLGTNADPLGVDASKFATSAQGDKADTAVQPADLNDYQSKIDSSHKLSADLIVDGETNKTVTATEKTTWDNKGTYSKPDSGIPENDLSDAVKAKLNSGSNNSIINVKDYDAKGDGVTDDTTAIQNAIEYSKTNGGIVFFPKGTYLLSTVLFNPSTPGIASALMCYDGQILLGEKATLKIGDASVTHTIFTYNDSQATGYNGAKDIIIDGLTFDGNSNLSSNITHVNVSHSSNIIIRNCNFLNGRNWHYIEINSSENVKVYNCNFDSYQLVNGSYSESIQIDAAVGGGNLGSDDNTVCKDISIYNNKFNQNNMPAIGNHYNAMHTNIRIYNNIFSGSNTTRGYIDFVSFTKNVDVYDNTFYGGTYGVVIPNVNKNSGVFNNRFEGTTNPYSNLGIIKWTNIINNTLDIGDIQGSFETFAVVTNDLLNVNTSNTAPLTRIGNQYVATLSPKQDFEITDVSVVMNNIDITSTAYDSLTKTITISDVSGDIIITAVAINANQCTITNNLTNITNSNQDVIIQKNTAYSATLTPISEYAIDTVTITMGETDITSTAYNDGDIYIATVTGDIVITATAIEDLTLPNGYTRVKQLKATGTQYIETDYITKTNTDLRINDFSSTVMATRYQAYIGAATADNASDSFEFREHQDTRQLNYTRGNNKAVWTTQGVNSADLIKLYDKTMTIDGVDWEITQTTITNGVRPLMFFARNLGGTADRLSNAQMGIIKIYEGDTLVKLYIPALDDNNVPCYYEKVEQETLYNSGTGTFATIPLQ